MSSICLIIGLIIVAVAVVGAVVSLVADSMVGFMTLLISLAAAPQGVLLMLLPRLCGSKRRYSVQTGLFCAVAFGVQCVLAAIIQAELFPWGALALAVGARVQSVLQMKKGKPELVIKLLVILLSTAAAYPLHYLFGGLLI